MLAQVAGKLMLAPIFEADFEDHASSSHPARGAADAVRTCIGIYIYAGYRHFDSSSRCTDLVTAATLLWGSVACCSACHVHY
jgi:hypothetical protein